MSKSLLAAEVAALEAFADQLDAKGTPPTAAELKEVQERLDRVKNLKSTEKINQERAEAEVFMRQLSGGTAGPGVVPSFDDRLKWAEHVAEKVTKATGQHGVKALSTGGIDIPQPISPVVPLTVEPARVLDLLIDRKAVSGNEFEYLRQTVRTNNAAPVADGATKPTSVYTFEDEFDRVRVFAHLSEAIPVRYLNDHEEIRRILGSQMAEDLTLALEEDALVGDGTGEHFTGIANVSGTQSQAYSTDVLTTLRKALTKLTTSGENPNAWVMNHADLEAIDLTREDGATGGFMAGIDEKIFGNLPKIGSSVIPAGTAYLGDWRQARLFVRQNGTLDADMSGTLFEKNQVKLRYEGRFGFAVLRPHAFIEVDLTA